jgi:hypothetical protein
MLMALKIYLILGVFLAFCGVVQCVRNGDRDWGLAEIVVSILLWPFILHWVYKAWKRGELE